MSALQLLQAYGSETETSDDEFIGFDVEPAGDPSSFKTFLLDKYGADGIQKLDKYTMENTGHTSNSEEEELEDSDGSFFEIENRKRKRTKKEIQNASNAQNRRLAHKLLIAKCGCRRNCDQIVSKDERLNVHDQFWKLDKTKQTLYIRENVHRSPVPLRHKNRTTANDPKKDPPIFSPSV